MVISYVLCSLCPSPKLGLGKLPPKVVHLWRSGLPSGLRKCSAPVSVGLRSQGHVTVVRMDAIHKSWESAAASYSAVLRSISCPCDCLNIAFFHEMGYRSIFKVKKTN